MQKKIPVHIAIVMDGNGRWAQRRHLPRIAGHKAGVENVRKIVQLCSQNKIQALTLFAFSTENWARPKSEVDFLMNLFGQSLRNEIKELHANHVQIKIVGDVSKFNEKLRAAIKQAEDLTANNFGLKLNIALNYSGRWDITQAMQKIGMQIEVGTLESQNINEKVIQSNLCFSALPEPDLFIRTSGELRISNFMLWQLAYTELYFTNVLWPDFDEKEFDQALEAFAKRERRFGEIEDPV